MSSLAALVIWLVIAGDAPEGLSASFHFYKKVERAPSKQEGIASFTLDSEIYANTRNGLADLRIYDETGAETPFQLETVFKNREEKARRNFEMVVVGLRPEGNAMEIHLRLPDSAGEANGLIFATPLRNYERKVSISGSTDGKKWEPLVSNEIIFDYSQYMDISSRDILLPKNTCREFKITVTDLTVESESPFRALSKTFVDAKEERKVELTVLERRPFRINGISGWKEEQIKAISLTTLPLAGMQIVEDTTEKQTLITVRTHREPLMRLTVETPSRNFSRRITVRVAAPKGPSTSGAKPATRLGGSEGKKEWLTIAEGTIENISFLEQKTEKVSIDFPERREDEFQIVIHNEDNPRLEITGVRAEGSTLRSVFLAQAGRTYRAFYGSDNAEAPKYDAGQVIANLLKNNQPMAVGLGKQTDNPDFVFKATPSKRGILDNWLFLGTAIGIMVIFLGWSLFLAGRRLESLPPE